MNHNEWHNTLHNSPVAALAQGDGARAQGVQHNTPTAEAITAHLAQIRTALDELSGPEREEAEEIIHGQDDTPRGILGVGPKATWKEIQKAYRLKAMTCHPDLCSQHGLSPEIATAAFKKLQAAFTLLEREFGK